MEKFSLTDFVPLNLQWNSMKHTTEQRTIILSPIHCVMPFGFQMLNGVTMDCLHSAIPNYQHVPVSYTKPCNSCVTAVSLQFLSHLVCLERMDESVDGVLTILCNHAFHANCLIKWGDSTCPVCRCVQTPELAESSVCMECEGTEALWICLICGHVGCGRFVDSNLNVWC